jgi:hypothetical protein
LQHAPELRRDADLLHPALDRLEHLRVPAEPVQGAGLAVARTRSLLGRRGHAVRLPGQVEHELVAAGSMRLARRPIERVEIRAVGAEAAVRATAPEKSRHVTDRPVEHARELDHEVELRNAGARYELRGIPPQRPGQLLARPPLVRLRQFQELLQPLLSYGRRIHGANPSSPSCPSSSKADGAALRLPPPASAATNVAIDKAATGQRRKNCVFSSRALKGRSAAERQPERNSAAFSEPGGRAGTSRPT